MSLVEEGWKQRATSGDAMATNWGSLAIRTRKTSIDKVGLVAFASLGHWVLNGEQECHSSNSPEKIFVPFWILSSPLIGAIRPSCVGLQNCEVLADSKTTVWKFGSSVNYKEEWSILWLKSKVNSKSIRVNCSFTTWVCWASLRQLVRAWIDDCS